MPTSSNRSQALNTPYQLLSAFLNLCERQPYREYRAVSFASVVCVNRAAVKLYEVANNRRPKSKTAMSARACRIGLTEAVKNKWGGNRA